jgi:hypothetical protein
LFQFISSTLIFFYAHAHWQHLLAIMPAAAMRDCTHFGHLGWHNRDRIIFIFVASPKEAKVSTVTCNCCWHYRTKLCQRKYSFNLISFQFCFFLNINFSLLLALSCAQRHLQHFIRCLWLCRSKCACFIVIATVFEMKKKIITKNYF